MAEVKMTMPVGAEHEEGLIRLDRMYESLRYNDYSVEGGLGEIVDNSVEARAANISLEIKLEKLSGQRKDTITEIAVIDDGVGMDADTLRKCLVLGESLRPAGIGKRGIGRFGVGMTLGSISLARRIEVYSRKKANENFLFTYIDLDEIQNGNLTKIPLPVFQHPDEKYAKLIEKSGGTIVVLKNCDRATSSIEGLANYLGRTYRKFIEAMLTIKLNGEKVYLHDPLYMAGPTVFDIKGQKPDEKAEPLGDIHIIPLEIPKSNGEKANVIIRMSLLPKEWRLIRGAGGKDFAKKRKIDQNMGISILRADREVLYGHIPRSIGKSTGESDANVIDRWWGCEISFPPELDDYFQVRYIKRGAEPVKSLLDTMRPIIIGYVDTARKRIKTDWAVQTGEENKTSGAYKEAEDIMEIVDNLLPRSRRGQNLSEKEVEQKLDKVVDEGSSSAENEASRKKKKDDLKKKPYAVELVNYPQNILFETEHLPGLTIVKINVNHPFYKRVLLPLCGSFDAENDCDMSEVNDKGEVKNAILLLLFAYAKAESMFPNNNDLFENLRTQWGTVLATAINRQYEKEDLK